jgi:hypothetical protein
MIFFLIRWFHCKDPNSRCSILWWDQFYNIEGCQSRSMLEKKGKEKKKK